MIDAILDTNIFIQASLSRTQSASYRTVRAHEMGRFQPVFSEDTVDELVDVLMLPRMVDRLGWSDDDVLDFVLSFVDDALVYVDVPPVSHGLAHDITDTKFLALAVVSEADFLVTNDRRHLLPLRQYGGTRIVTPAQFLREL